jgi:hypothetical protein
VFEVTPLRSVAELRARIGRGAMGWPHDVPWLPAGATAADLAAGRVRADARAEAAWGRPWAEVELALFRLGRVMEVLVEARDGGESVPRELWEFTRGVHRAAAWTLGVTTLMPLDAGWGPVTQAAIKRVCEVAAEWGAWPVWRCDPDGVIEWLAWLDGEIEEIPYPVD